MARSRVAVDTFCKLYTLNYAMLISAQRVEPTLSQWVASTCVTRESGVHGNGAGEMSIGGKMWVFWVVVLGIPTALAPRSALAQPGCCVCTSCTAPALFACRDALDDMACQTTCTTLGCSAHQFNSGTDCIDTAQCYGDCCDALDGSCGQAHQADCTSDNMYFPNEFCDGSNCLAAPPPTQTGTATSTETATATPSHSHTPTVTDTPTATASPSRTPTATATRTPSHSPTQPATATATPSRTPTATGTASRTSTASATVSPTITRTPSTTPTPSVTPTPGRLSWLFNGQRPLIKVYSPLNGYTFVFPYRGTKPSLDLVDSASRFCTQPGLTPQVRLDLNPADCENQCTIGVFPQDSTSATHIAHLPSLLRAAGTFDVLIDTVIGCQPGQAPTQLRMPAAVTYVNCVGDCNGDNAVMIDELMLAVNIALGAIDTGACLVSDRDASGTVQIDELVAAVDAALQGCGG